MADKPLGTPVGTVGSQLFDALVQISIFSDFTTVLEGKEKLNA